MRAALLVHLALCVFWFVLCLVSLCFEVALAYRVHGRTHDALWIWRHTLVSDTTLWFLISVGLLVSSIQVWRYAP